MVYIQYYISTVIIIKHIKHIVIGTQKNISTLQRLYMFTIRVDTLKRQNVIKYNFINNYLK